MAQRFRRAPLDAPMGFDIDAFRCCRAFPRRPDQLDVSPASELAWRPRTRTSWGRQSVSALSGSSRPMLGARPKVGTCRSRLVGSPKTAAVSGPARSHPERRERNRSRVAPAHPEGGASAASRETPKGPRDADGSTPKGRSTPSAPWHPKALGIRTNRIRSPKGPSAIQRTPRRVAPVVRARAPQPCAVTRAPLRNPLAADFRRPKAWSSARHSAPASRRTLCRTLPLDPRRNHSGRASRSATRR